MQIWKYISQPSISRGRNFDNSIKDPVIANNFHCLVFAVAWQYRIGKLWQRVVVVTFKNPLKIYQKKVPSASSPQSPEINQFIMITCLQCRGACKKESVGKVQLLWCHHTYHSTINRWYYSDISHFITEIIHSAIILSLFLICTLHAPPPETEAPPSTDRRRRSTRSRSLIFMAL